MRISVLIPCFNEEKSIVQAVKACLAQTRKPDQIVVVNDGSTDGSRKKLARFSKVIRIVDLAVNTGNKSRAQQEGLKYVTGDVFVTTDADSVLDREFVARVEKAFVDKSVAAFAGYVKSVQHNFLTACRELDYVIGQRIHKAAQDRLDALYVIPGCAGAFRTAVFKKCISFDHDTLTEDLDFTFKLHKLGLKIVYDKEAVCYTQDPATWSSYINQMRRWYAGGWQNIRKHIDIVSRPKNTLELAMTYIEGLVFSVMLFIVPIVNLRYYLFVVVGYSVAIMLFAVIASLVSKRRDVLIYSPIYFALMYVNAWIFMEQFVSEIVLSRRNLVWFHPERRIAI